MAWGKTDEQKLAEKALREEQGRMQQEQQAQAAHAATPVGRAEAAHRIGDEFFQLELSIAEFRQKKVTPRAPLGGLLGHIEAVGWKLESASYVPVQTSSHTNHSPIMSATDHEGHVMGIYLFRRVASPS